MQDTTVQNIKEVMSPEVVATDGFLSDGIVPSYSSWGWLLLITALLLGLYFALGFMGTLIRAVKIRRPLRTALDKTLRVVRILFEPVALGVWTAVLIGISPVIIGSLCLVMVILANYHIRNYISGRLFLLENSLREGEELLLSDSRGEIVRMGRLGVKARMDGTLKHLNYLHLLHRGYTLASGSETGEFFHLKISLQEGEEKEGKAKEEDRLAVLEDLMATSPFVDWSYEPELMQVEGEKNEWLAHIQLRQNGHLPELVRFLEEAGYACVSNPKRNSRRA